MQSVYLTFNWDLPREGGAWALGYTFLPLLVFLGPIVHGTNKHSVTGPELQSYTWALPRQADYNDELTMRSGWQWAADMIWTNIETNFKQLRNFSTENVNTGLECTRFQISQLPLPANAELLELKDRFNPNDHLALHYSIAPRGWGTSSHGAPGASQLPYREEGENQLIDLLLSGSLWVRLMQPVHATNSYTNVNQ